MTARKPGAGDPLPMHPEEWLRSRGYIPRHDGAWGAWQRGTCFSPGQMEDFTPPGDAYDADGMFHVVELETGDWIADLRLHSTTMPDLTSQLYPSREAALRGAVERVARRLIPRVIGWELHGKWMSPWTLPASVSRERAEAILAWACPIAGMPVIRIPDRHPLQPPPPQPHAELGPLFAAASPQR